MLKKLNILLLFFILFSSNVGHSGERNDKNLLAISGGIWDWNDTKTSGMFNIEYRHGT